MTSSFTQVWEVGERDFPDGGTPEAWLEFALRYAILAPSGHTPVRAPGGARHEDAIALLLPAREAAVAAPARGAGQGVLLRPSRRLQVLTVSPAQVGADAQSCQRERTLRGASIQEKDLGGAAGCRSRLGHR